MIHLPLARLQLNLPQLEYTTMRSAEIVATSVARSATTWNCIVSFLLLDWLVNKISEMSDMWWRLLWIGEIECRSSWENWVGLACWNIASEFDVLEYYWHLGSSSIYILSFKRVSLSFSLHTQTFLSCKTTCNQVVTIWPAWYSYRAKLSLISLLPNATCSIQQPNKEHEIVAWPKFASTDELRHGNSTTILHVLENTRVGDSSTGLLVGSHGTCVKQIYSEERFQAQWALNCHWYLRR